MSCSVRMDSSAVCVWTAKMQKLKYILGIAAMTAGQIIVYISLTIPLPLFIRPPKQIPGYLSVRPFGREKTTKQDQEYLHNIYKLNCSRRRKVAITRIDSSSKHANG